MTRKVLIQRLGLGLLALAFAAATVRLARRTQVVSAPGTITLRFSHWQLEGGLREAYDAVAERYMQLHPNVRVEQMAIPERVYGAWMRTQLVGGTAPDLIEFGQMPADTVDEILARNFVPLSETLERPNPYNRGTPLEKTSWRETFVDGLDTAYRSSNLREYYKIPTAMFTLRIYYNRELWRELLGNTAEPRTFAEFMEISQRVHAIAMEKHQPLVAVAGSRSNFAAIDREFGSQTQRLSLAVDVDRNLGLANSEIAVAWLRKQWTSDSPEFTRGLEISRDLIRTMSPGFTQLTREDASFLFVQRRALMIVAGSWDFTSLTQQAPFPLGVFSLPLPSIDDARYGKDVLGDMSEAETGAESSFALTAGSQHPEVALDFLQFITSQEGNRLFMEKSRWLPAIVGVQPLENQRPFIPVVDGYPNGFNARQFANLGFETRRLWETNLGLLGSPSDGVGRVSAIYREQLPAAIRSDLTRLITAYLASGARQDTTLAALTGLMHGASVPEAANAARKRSELFQQQNAKEAEAYWSASELSTTAP